MKVLFCASEVAPFAKTGGLADVAGSLPLALGELGVEIRIAMPRYRGVSVSGQKLAPNVSIDFIEHEAYFNRSSYYGNPGGDYPDNLERFQFFCEESLALVKRTGFKPDLVHAHDWQAALLPVLLKTKLAGDPFFKKTKSILTIHNLAYQGNFPAGHFSKLGLEESLYSVNGLEFYGKVNLLKGGLLFADRINTVSPTYAQEIQTPEYGFGLDGVVRGRADVLSGILNGIDTALWNPATDASLKARYSKEDLSGKAECKAELQRRSGFEVRPDLPLFGIVSRLAEQKGLDMLAEIADKLLEKETQFVMLGEGDPAYHTTFRNVAARHPKNARVRLGFDSAEARAIYAGADFFLMPSYFEPCGLGQFISFRYGTLPIVRATGGLADTVKDADEDAKNGNGFVFQPPNGDAFFKAIERALGAFKDPKRMQNLSRRVMGLDFSWKRSAEDYKKLYERVCS